LPWVGQHPGQFEQGERVPVGLGQHAIAAVGRQAGAKQRGGHLSGQALHGQRWQPGRREGTSARAEKQDDRLGVQPPGGEQQSVSAGPVQPVRVVQHAEQRLADGEFAEQRQHREADQEAVRRPGFGQPDGAPQCLRLDVGQRGDAVERRAQQQVQPGEG
jgi:hypothetical protein